MKERRRLPSGFGTIRNLGKGRKRPFAVHPPAAACHTEAGRGWRRPPAICYVSTWENGLKILALYHIGEYKKGMEIKLEKCRFRAGKEDYPFTKREWKKTSRCISVDIPATREELEQYGLAVQKEIDNPVVERGNEDDGKTITISDREAEGHPAGNETGGMFDNSASGNSGDRKAGKIANSVTGNSGNREAGNIANSAAENSGNREAGNIVSRASGKIANSAAGNDGAFGKGNGQGYDGKEKGKTFAQVYQAFFQYQFGPHARRKLSKSTRNATKAAYKHFAPLYDRPLDEIKVDELQEIVNAAAGRGYSRSSVNRMVTLIHQLYRYAWPRDLCSKECGRYVDMPGCLREKHHQAFTDEELAKIWKEYRSSSNTILGMILVMCYSGFRVGEYESDSFSLCFSNDTFESGYFCGGFKTEAGRDRIVPVHSGILPLIRDMLDEKGMPVFFSGRTSGWFREEMKKALVNIGIDHDRSRTAENGDLRYHTPHSCRHTFSRLCESSGVNEADRKRLMGHSFGHDITNGVYGHRSVEELRAEIEKIQLPENAPENT